MSIFAGKIKVIFDFPICSPAGLLDITVILPHNQRWAKLLQKRIADQVLSNEFSLKITLLKLIWFKSGDNHGTVPFTGFYFDQHAAALQ
jgi:hypothetical protein